MKKSEIKVGGIYTARVGGKYTTVRVDAIRECSGWERDVTRYDCTNLTTNRKVMFRSAAKFRKEVNMDEKYPKIDIAAFAEQLCPDDQIDRSNQPAPTYDEDTGTWSDNNEEEGGQSADPTAVAANCLTATALATSTAQAATTPVPTATTEVSLGLAARIAATREKRSSVPDVVAGYTPTDEQRLILETVLKILEGDGPKVLVIEAGAGAGKTSTLKMLEEVMPGSGQYTAFNRSLVDDSRPKFRKARCNTTHSLAFMPVGRRYSHRLNGDRVTSREVASRLGINDMMVELETLPVGSDAYIRAAEKAGYTQDNPPPVDYAPRGTKILSRAFLAGQVTQALKRFSQSADPVLCENHIEYIDGIDKREENGKRGFANNRRVREYLMPFVRQAWKEVEAVDGQYPFTHDYYVKLWQLGTPIISASYILLDEDQDTAPVFADIIRRQQQATVVLVGDSNQRIYGWRGAINATDLFPDAPVCYLTQSFRFGQCLADVANSILAGLEEPTKLRMRGIDCPTRILMGDGESDVEDTSEYKGKVCYLYRTNAGALGRILREFDQGRRGCLIGNVADIVKFVKGALVLQAGRRTDCPDLAVFESWSEVQRYVEEDPDGADLKLMVKLVDDFGGNAILSALDDMPAEEQAEFVASTAHKSKGREWDTVVLGSDFPPACNMGDDDRRLLYVAATRAKLVLDLSVCTPFREYTDKLTGDITPGIEINYTVPMPGARDLDAWLKAKEEEEEAKAPTPTIATVPAKQTAPQAVQAPAPTTPATQFSYGSLNGEWYVRGPAGYENKEVTVTLKSGSKRTELLKKKVKTVGEWAFYEK